MSAIEVSELRKSYGDILAMDGVSLEVEQGEIFGILGPNGAGKTTLVECLEGLRKPDAGSIRVLGLDPIRDRAALLPKIGAQLQTGELPERMKVWEALDLYSSFYPDPLPWRESIETWGLQQKRNASFGTLSGGQKQRLFIALALVGNPQIAILDELTTGLDPQARRDAWALIEGVRAAGVTVVLVTHFMEEAEHLCDRLAIIDGGRIVAIDTPAGLISRTGIGQRVAFHPSGPLDPEELMSLSAVKEVSVRNGEVLVTGQDDVVQELLAFLSGKAITADRLRVKQPTLDDAFAALTGRVLHD